MHLVEAKPSLLSFRAAQPGGLPDRSGLVFELRV